METYVLERLFPPKVIAPKQVSPLKIVCKRKYLLRFNCPVHNHTETISLSESVRDDGFRFFSLYGNKCKCKVKQRGKHFRVEIQPIIENRGFKLSVEKLNFWLLISAVFTILKREFMEKNIKSYSITLTIDKDVVRYRWRDEKEKFMATEILNGGLVEWFGLCLK